jgi:hypothetical protein
MDRFHQATDISDSHPRIHLVARLACQTVYVGSLAPDEQDVLARVDAGMDLRWQNIAHEGIPQRHKVDIDRLEKARKLIERNKLGTIDLHAARKEFLFDTIGLRTSGI